jgi:sodium-dependent dicarboxylate transporter 2/3/5
MILLLGFSPVQNLGEKLGNPKSGSAVLAGSDLLGIDSTIRASLLCKFVSCIAAAKNNAAATRATADVANPLNANDNALEI